MVMVLFIMSIFCSYSLFGMNDYSNTPKSSKEDEKDIPINIEQELNHKNFQDNFEITDYNDNHLNNNYVSEKYSTKHNCDVENFSQMTEENQNAYTGLKRKRKSDKIFKCDFCQRESAKCIKGKHNDKSLCKPCYTYERKYGNLVPLDERKKRYNVKHKDSILVCEFCERESTQYQTGKITGKSLCHACYTYEMKYSNLVPLDERRKRYNVKHKYRILVCEFCERESTNYRKGKVSGKTLCRECYYYEKKYTHLIPLDERRHFGKHKKIILVCEFCQQDTTNYRKGKVSGKSLCESCYRYEYRHGYLVPSDERKKYNRNNVNTVKTGSTQWID
jgi:formylmethanofuran dehydrogenase subunit E